MDSLPRVEMLVRENEIPEWIEAIPFAHVLQADNVCRQYAATLEWPMMEMEILFQVDLRLEAAHDLCAAMGEKELSKALEGGNLIAMALIDFWHEFFDCTINSNTASGTYSAAYGGGARDCALYRCIVTSNLSVYGGGIYGGNAYSSLIAYNRASSGWSGVLDSNLRNCTVVSNSGGSYGIRAIGVGVTNTIVYYNTPANLADPAGLYSYCNTGELVTGPGGGNTTNPPAFVNKDGGNFRLTRESPGVNRGTNQPWMDNTTDLDGRRRIDPISRQVDMGAYEFLPQGTFFTAH